MCAYKPPELNISLESHLVGALRPLLQIVPTELADTLTLYLSRSPPPATIPYSVLQSVSQWSRTSSGLTALASYSPPLDPQAYSMISLLAGTTTSPERKFGLYTPAQEPEEVEAERRKERKTITALLNALLSIGGSAAATWWAGEKAGWRNEWRVLVSLFIAIVVAITEAVLYIIWQSRRSTTRPAKTRRRLISAKHKKDDGNLNMSDPTSTSVVALTSEGALRRRQ